MTIAGTLDFPASNGELVRLEMYNSESRQGSRRVPVRLYNLSATGVLIESSQALRLGEQIETAFNDHDVVKGQIGWTGARLYGCQFAAPVASTLLEKAVWRRLDDADNGDSQPQLVDTFGARLQRLRMAQGLSQVEIAAQLGVTPVAISNWESDRSQPRQHRMSDLAKILGVPSQQLVAHSGVHPESLPEVLASSKVQIANLLGVNPTNVKISVDL